MFSFGHGLFDSVVQLAVHGSIVNFIVFHLPGTQLLPQVIHGTSPQRLQTEKAVSEYTFRLDPSCCEVRGEISWRHGRLAHR